MYVPNTRKCSEYISKQIILSFNLYLHLMHARLEVFTYVYSSEKEYKYYYKVNNVFFLTIVKLYDNVCFFKVYNYESVLNTCLSKRINALSVKK